MKNKRNLFRLKLIKRLVTLINQPLFWFMTILGNMMILLGSFLLYQFESKQETNLIFLDYLLWSAGIITTVGYADYVPQTMFGKLTVLGLMLLGTIFIWSYMAFLVSALISPALTSLEKEVQDVEKEISDLKEEEQKTALKRSIYE
jgi:voltage-gated potassium channel Kch